MAKLRKRNDSASVIDASRESFSTDDNRLNDADARSRIATRAYELYLERGAADGGDFDDWLAAERELASRREADRTQDDE